jgi:hypothetical protein
MKINNNEKHGDFPLQCSDYQTVSSVSEAHGGRNQQWFEEVTPTMLMGFHWNIAL